MPFEATPEKQDVPIERQTAGYLQPGVIIDERYRIESFLGSGGMCSVYKAEHLQLGKPVALKFLRGDLALDAGAVQRFRQETIVVGAMSHPNIVEVYGFGIFNNRPYMALAFLEGVSLAAVLLEQPENRLPEERALPIFLQICDALTHAHGKGVLHRDLKPSNVMLVDNQQTVRLVDFGVAKVLPESGKELQKLTQTGQLLGSAPYMSPEQCLCQPLDARSDIYALGCLMYEVITGAPPFATSNAYSTIAHHVGTEAEDKASLHTPLGSVILRCLAKDPAMRPQSAAQLKELLLKPTPRKFSIRKKDIYAIVGVALVIAAIAGVAYESVLFRESTLEMQRSSLTEAESAIRSADKLLADALDRRTDLPADAVRNLTLIIGHYENALKLAECSKDTETIKEAKAKLANALVQTKVLTGIGSAQNDNRAIALCQEIFKEEPLRKDLSQRCLMTVETIATAYMNRGEFVKAQPWLEDYANLGPQQKRPWAAMRQAQANAALHNWRGAIDKYQKVMHEEMIARPTADKMTDVLLVAAQLEIAKAYIENSQRNKRHPDYKTGVEMLRAIANSPKAAPAVQEDAKNFLTAINEPSK